MKKFLSLLLVVATLLSVGLLAGCAETGFDYRNSDLTPYVTLGNYKGKLNVTIAKLAETIEDEDVLKEITDMLASAAIPYKKLDEAGLTVEQGDTVGILFKGILLDTLITGEHIVKNSDNTALTDQQILDQLNAKNNGAGLTEDQIKDISGFDGGSNMTTTSSSTEPTPSDLMIGSGSFIDGFEDALVGFKVGDPLKPIVVTFPNPYSANTELSGKRVVFFVKVMYELQLVDLRDIEFGDYLALTYVAKMIGTVKPGENEGDEPTLENTEDTKAYLDGLYTYTSPEVSEDKRFTGILGTYSSEGALTGGLNKDTQLHAAFLAAINEAREAGTFELNKEFTFTDDVVLSCTPKGGGEKESVTVRVEYTTTVTSLATVRYMAAEDVGTERYSYEDFCEDLKVDDEKFADYAAYKADLKDAMQKERDIQILANKYQGAFQALVKSCPKLDISSPEMQKLVDSYKSEVLGNIEYLTMQAQASGYEYYYSMYYSTYKVSNLREYIMYTNYGYKDSTINTQLQTDAETYVKERLVFWRFVQVENIVLTEKEYNDGLAKYKEIYESDTFMEDNNIPEEALREALLWDKVAKLLVDNYTTIETAPVKEA